MTMKMNKAVKTGNILFMSMLTALKNISRKPVRRNRPAVVFPVRSYWE